MADVNLYTGDCLEVMQRLIDEGVQVDSIVTDPPYHLTSIVKRFGKSDSAAVVTEGKTADSMASAYARASKGFMGKAWDGGDLAFRVETWALALQLLKPGGHLVAFSGTRTYHRMAVAIEDAGFEVRDQLAWVYGSGFPKSHDVSKGIDKRKDWAALSELQNVVKSARLKIGISQSEAARRMNLIGPNETLGGGGFMWFETGRKVPTRDQWPNLKRALELDDSLDNAFEAVEREVIGQHVSGSTPGGFGDHRFSFNSRDITAPGSTESERWQGWGSALKPAWEPIVLARKPISESSIAANVLKYGTGAVNIDGCRVDSEKLTGWAGAGAGGNTWNESNMGLGNDGPARPVDGRWPANIIHDGSDEVLAAFPDASGQQRDIDHNTPSTKTSNVYGKMSRIGEASAERRYTESGSTNFAASPGARRLDSGSAARFFYSAKADADDRYGSKHPTVKPVDLMAWLVRLITPPGGTVLDCFAGSGTTGAAALREGMNAILIERDPEYAKDIAERVAYLKGHGGHSASTKNRNKPVKIDDLPLFGDGEVA